MDRIDKFGKLESYYKIGIWPSVGNCLFIHLLPFQVKNILVFGFFNLRSIWQIFDGNFLTIMDFHIAQFELLSFTMEVEFSSISIPFKNTYPHNQALILLGGKLMWIIEYSPAQVKRFLHNNSNLSTITQSNKKGP